MLLRYHLTVFRQEQHGEQVRNRDAAYEQKDGMHAGSQLRFGAKRGHMLVVNGAEHRDADRLAHRAKQHAGSVRDAALFPADDRLHDNGGRRRDEAHSQPE